MSFYRNVVHLAFGPRPGVLCDLDKVSGDRRCGAHRSHRAHRLSWSNQHVVRCRLSVVGALRLQDEVFREGRTEKNHLRDNVLM